MITYLFYSFYYCEIAPMKYGYRNASTQKEVTHIIDKSYVNNDRENINDSSMFSL